MASMVSNQVMVANAGGSAGTSTGVVGINNLDIGFSASGLEEYIKLIDVKLLQNIQTELNNTDTLINTINAGWVGKSRDIFLQQFEQSINAVINDVQAEYEDLMTRFSEIQSNYYEQDNELMNS